MPVTSSGGMAYSTSALTSDDHKEWTKHKHCCLWPHQWVRSMVTQHLPVMTRKNRRRGELHMSLPGCRHGGLRCCHERRGLMAKQKLIRIFGHITPLHMPPHPLAILHCCGALRGSEQLQCSSEWWWRPPQHKPQILKDGVEEEWLAGTATLDPHGPDGPPR